MESRKEWNVGSSYRLDYYNRPYPNGYHIYATDYAAWVSLHWVAQLAEQQAAAREQQAARVSLHWVAQLVPGMTVLTKYTIRRVRLRRLVAAGYEQNQLGMEVACPVWVGQEILIEPTAVERFKWFLRKWLVRLLRLLPV
jgi:hypothetical protein